MSILLLICLMIYEYFDERRLCCCIKQVAKAQFRGNSFQYRVKIQNNSLGICKYKHIKERHVPLADIHSNSNKTSRKLERGERAHPAAHVSGAAADQLCFGKHRDSKPKERDFVSLHFLLYGTAGDVIAGEKTRAKLHKVRKEERSVLDDFF